MWDRPFDGSQKLEKNGETCILVRLRAMLGCGRLKCVHSLMTDITWEGDIKLAVISTDVEGRQKYKIQNEQLTWD